MHHGLRPPAFTVRPRARLAEGKPEISRFPYKRRTRVPGSLDNAESPGTRDIALGHIAFCRLEGIGTPKSLTPLNG